MSENITTIILDWAGTTIDFGCFAPVDAFRAAFEKFGVLPTMEEIRAPMGLSKRTHIKKMLLGKRLSRLWSEQYGREFLEQDVDRIYAEFEPALFSVLGKHSDIIPGVLQTIAEIRAMGIAIGSTTGYTKTMMDVVAPAAKTNGYEPDSLVCPSETGGIGRPFPYMLWRNLELLGTKSIDNVIKIGDTVADINEGKNAGCITVGLIKGSSLLGLSHEEYKQKTDAELIKLHETTRKKYLTAHVDYVIDSIVELPALIKKMNKERA